MIPDFSLKEALTAPKPVDSKLLEVAKILSSVATANNSIVNQFFSNDKQIDGFMNCIVKNGSFWQKEEYGVILFNVAKKIASMLNDGNTIHLKSKAKFFELLYKGCC